jgi:PKD repeat protein
MLVTTTNFGCMDSLSKNVYIRPQTAIVWAFADTITSKCLRGNSYNYTNNSTISSGTYTFLWEFGDATTSTANPATHSYSTAGTFSPRLVTTTNFGCMDSLSKNVYLRYNPVAAFTTLDTAECLNTNNFSFTNTSTIGGGTFTQLWKFGDGNTSTTKNPKYSYSSVNTFNPELIVSSNFGCMDSTMKTLYTYPDARVKFSVNGRQQCIGANMFVFSDSSKLLYGTMSTYWNFGDMTTSTSFNATHSYNRDTTYLVTLKVITDKACTDSTTDTIIVLPKPSANFTVNDTAMCLYGNKFNFTDNSTPPFNDTIFTYVWNFGDNSPDIDILNASHSYNKDTTFFVRHSIMTVKGCVDTIIKPVRIYPQPKLAFVVNDTSQCFVSNNFIFTNFSTINYPDTMTYKWYFGDTNTSILTNPTHTYKIVNMYPVKLTAVSKLHCSDTLIQYVRVKPQPVINIGKDTTFNINQWTDTMKFNFNTGLGYDSILWFNNTKYNTLAIDTVIQKDTILRVWVKVAKNGCFTTDTVNLTIHYKITGIDNIAYDFKLSVYPNPTRDILNIWMKGLRNDVVFELTDMNGRIVQTMKVQSSQNATLKTMDLAGLAKGVYFLNIKDNANKQSVKIVKY